jgi:hypothetical protein
MELEGILSWPAEQSGSLSLQYRIELVTSGWGAPSGAPGTKADRRDSKVCHQSARDN